MTPALQQSRVRRLWRHLSVASPGKSSRNLQQIDRLQDGRWDDCRALTRSSIHLGCSRLAFFLFRRTRGKCATKSSAHQCRKFP